MTTLTTLAAAAPALPLNGTTDPGSLRAAHTPDVPAPLRQPGASLSVTTDQAGKLVMVRDDETLLESSFVIPTECLGEVAATVRASGPA
jgi:hypothetical protein